jgi:hypothetical protein
MKTETGNVHTPALIDANGHRFVPAVQLPRVLSDPNGFTRGIVFDGDAVSKLEGPCAKTHNVHVPALVTRERVRSGSRVRWPTVATHPSRVSVRVEFGGMEIVGRNWDIDVPA